MTIIMATNAACAALSASNIIVIGMYILAQGMLETTTLLTIKCKGQEFTPQR